MSAPGALAATLEAAAHTPAVAGAMVMAARLMAGTMVMAVLPWQRPRSSPVPRPRSRPVQYLAHTPAVAGDVVMAQAVHVVMPQLAWQ